MSTHAILMRNLDDSYVEAIYVHSDGYPSRLGRVLYDHYNNPDRVTALFALGDCSCVCPILEPDPKRGEHNLYCHQANTTVAYHRDCGEDLNIYKIVVGGSRFQTMPDAMKFLIDKTWAPYAYVWDKNQRMWFLDYGIEDAPKAITGERLDEWEKEGY